MKSEKPPKNEERHDLAVQIGSRIREIRKQQGLSLEALALKCDMNTAFLGHIERGMRCPTVYSIDRICKGLGISMATVFDSLDSGELDSSAYYQHIASRMKDLTPDQASKIVAIVDTAVDLIHSPPPA